MRLRERLAAAVFATTIAAIPLVATGQRGKGPCGTSTVCISKKQARALAAKKSKTTQSCPVTLDSKKISEGEGDDVGIRSHMQRLVFDAEATREARKAGRSNCCYTYQHMCKGRPLRERALARAARPRPGVTWTA